MEYLLLMRSGASIEPLFATAKADCTLVDVPPVVEKIYLSTFSKPLSLNAQTNRSPNSIIEDGLIEKNEPKKAKLMTNAVAPELRNPRM